jgi:hypothetical protein
VYKYFAPKPNKSVLSWPQVCQLDRKTKLHQSPDLIEIEVGGFVDAVQVNEPPEVLVIHEVGECVPQQNPEECAVAGEDEAAGAGPRRQILSNA